MSERLKSLSEFDTYPDHPCIEDYERILSALRRCERERDDAIAFASQLSEQREAALAALRKYGKHKAFCSIGEGLDRCSCGLDTSRKLLPDAPEGEAEGD